MSDLVNPDEIEVIVGVKRHSTWHYAHYISDWRVVYILHSFACKETTPDLRTCEYSIALDHGIENQIPWIFWRDLQDEPVPVEILSERWLIPSLPMMATLEGLQMKEIPYE